MYYEATDTRAVAKTSGLNEELGQVRYFKLYDSNIIEHFVGEVFINR